MARSSTRYGVALGLRAGIQIACLYAAILAVVWTASLSPTEVNWIQRLAGFLWFLLYGCIVGSILGAAIGVATGYLLVYLLQRLVPGVVKRAWLVGLLAGLSLCLVAYLLGYITILASAEQDPYPEKTYQLFWVIVGFPGVLYILSSTWLAEQFYRHIKLT